MRKVWVRTDLPISQCYWYKKYDQIWKDEGVGFQYWVESCSLSNVNSERVKRIISMKNSFESKTYYYNDDGIMKKIYISLRSV